MVKYSFGDSSALKTDGQTEFLQRRDKDARLIKIMTQQIVAAATIARDLEFTTVRDSLCVTLSILDIQCSLVDIEEYADCVGLDLDLER